jgi:Rrf2 family cysteine metabolism transcriptional repressor
VRALVELASRTAEVPVQGRDIARRQCIPEPYLYQVLTALRRAGLISSRRGPGGGHQLARPADQIRLSEVVEVLHGPLAIAVEPENVLARESPCTGALDDVWRALGARIEQTLSAVTLADIVARVRGRAYTYQI